MIPRGSVITFDVQGSAGHWIPRSTQGVREDAIDAMSPFVQIDSLSINRPGLFDDPATFVLGVNWPYESVVRIKTLFDHGKIDDLKLIVRNAFEVAAGEIPTVTARGFDANQDPQLPYDWNQGNPLEPPSTMLILLVIVIVLAVGAGVFAWKVAP